MGAIAVRFNLGPMHINAAYKIPALKERHVLLHRQFPSKNPSALSFPNLLNRGRWHTLITYGFVHNGWVHLLANLVAFKSAALITLSTPTSYREWYGLFFGSLAVSGAAQLGLHKFQSVCHKNKKAIIMKQPICGLSGAVFAQFGACSAWYGDAMTYDLFFTSKLKATDKQFLTIISGLSIAFAIRHVYKNKLPAVAHGAHLAGLLFGYGWGVATKQKHHHKSI